MALISKFSAILLIPMIAVIIAASLLIDSEPHLLPIGKNQHHPTYKLFQAAALFCIIFFFASLLFFPACFFNVFYSWFFVFWRFLIVSYVGSLVLFMCYF